jgi:hypothetical protein
MRVVPMVEPDEARHQLKHEHGTANDGAPQENGRQSNREAKVSDNI